MSASPESTGICDACNYGPVVVRAYRSPVGADDVLLCDFCANTRIGNRAMYPHQQTQGDWYVLKTLGFLANCLRTGVWPPDACQEDEEG